MAARDNDNYFAGEESKSITPNAASIIEDTKTEEEDDEEERKFEEGKKPDLLDSNADSVATDTITQINSSLVQSLDDPLQNNQQ